LQRLFLTICLISLISVLAYFQFGFPIAKIANHDLIIKTCFVMIPESVYVTNEPHKQNVRQLSVSLEVKDFDFRSNLSRNIGEEVCVGSYVLQDLSGLKTSLNLHSAFHFIRRSQTSVYDRTRRRKCDLISRKLKSDVGLLRIDIGPQLTNGGPFRSLNQSAGSDPQSTSRKKEQSGKTSQKSVRDLQPISKERRPKLASLLLAIVFMAAAFPICAHSQDAWQAGNKVKAVSGMVMIGLICFNATFGLLLGCDIFSLLAGP